MNLSRSILLCVIAFGVAAAHSGCTWPNKEPQGPSGQSALPEELAFEEGAKSPPSVKTKYAIARVLASQGDDQACDQLLCQIILEQPRCKPAYVLQADIRARRGRYDDAIQTLRAALSMFPSDHMLLNNIGVCYLLKKDHEAAVEWFTLAASAAPGNARYRANLAVALALQGREEEALALYRQSVGDKDAQHNLTVLHRARSKLYASTPEFTYHEEPNPETEQ